MNITVDGVAEWGANRLLMQANPPMNQERKRQLLPVTKYNLLVNVFNGSTVALVSAVVLTIFFAFSAALTIGAMGLFARFTTEKELGEYSFNRAAEFGLVHILRSAFPGALNGAFTEEPAGKKLLRPENWEATKVFVFGHAAWKNSLPVPVA